MVKQKYEWVSLKTALTEIMPVVGMYRIKPFITNDIPPSNKYFQNNRKNETMCKTCLKSLIKALERCQVRSFGYLIWKFLMLILMYLSAEHYFLSLLPFCRKIPSFWKKYFVEKKFYKKVFMGDCTILI